MLFETYENHYFFFSDFGESAPASTAVGNVIGNGSMSQDEILHQFIEYENSLKLNDLYRDFGVRFFHFFLAF